MIPCAKSELMLFDETPVQVAATSSAWVDFHPLNSVGKNIKSPLEFFVAATPDEYLDLNDTRLYLEVEVTASPANTTYAPVNLWLSSLFEDVTLEMNGVVVQGATQLYPYRAMIESMLLFDKSTKLTQLRAAGYHEDKAGKFEETTNNPGWVERASWTVGGKALELVGPLHLDMMTQSKYLLPGVDLKIFMKRTDINFNIISKDGTNPLLGCGVDITRAVLSIRKVKVEPNVLAGHELGLMNTNAIYPIQHVSMQSISAPSGISTFNRENIFQGKMPKMVVMAMVLNEALRGDIKFNPFNFQQFDVSYCGLFRDGECIPERTPYTMDMANKLARPYMAMIQSLEQYNRNENNGITLSDYGGGNCFFVFNLTPDLVVGSGCQQAWRSGNLRLEVKFRTALPAAINIVVYGVFDAKIEISKDRRIYLDYA